MSGQTRLHRLRRLQLGLFCAALCAAALARAVAVDPAGQGEVLIYPYFSTANGNDTLLKLINQSADSKAIKIRFREAGNGRELAAFNLYLGPFDIWSAGIYSQDGSGSRLLTLDTSCTLPRIRFSSSLPQAASGLPYLSFDTASFTGEHADGGPQTPARTREGWIEVIEMGRFAPDSAAHRAATRPDGWMPTLQDCDFFETAWGPAGQWTLDPSSEVLPPTGGLSGNASVINVADSTLYTFDATALSHFSIVAQHSAADAALPDLSSAITDPARQEVEALVVGEGRIYRSRWPQARAIDAVSAALLSSSIDNEFNVEGGLDARTDWLLTFPTRPYYTDPARTDIAMAPFTRRYAGASSSSNDAGLQCEPIEARLFDREQQQLPWLAAVSGIAVPQRPHTLCRSAQVVEFQGSAAAARSDTLLATDALPLQTAPFSGRPSNGHAVLEFTAPGQQLGPDLDGQVFQGLPVIGFAATRLRNLQARPGEIGNYTSASAHSASLSCVAAAPLCASQ